MDILTQASIVAAGAVLLVQTILRLKIVPVAFANRYPVPANIILSFVATFVTFNWVNVDITWDNWSVILKTLLIISVGAAIVYNQLIGKWKQLMEIQGDGKNG